MMVKKRTLVVAALLFSSVVTAQQQPGVIKLKVEKQLQIFFLCH